MGLSRCYTLIKCLLIIFNIIFLCAGCGACGLAAWAVREGWEGRGGLCALAAWGGALALAALLGLAGALRGSAALLAAALCLLALGLVAEGAAGWWGAAHQPQLRLALRDAMLHTVRHEYGRVHSPTQIFDVIQHELECCGADGPRDWQHSAWASAQEGGAGGEPGEPVALDLSVGAPGSHYWVPASCCGRPAGEECERARRLAASATGAAGGAGLHARGCWRRALAALGRLARAPLALAGALLVVHALALPLTLALWLHAHPRRNYKA